MQEAYTLTLPQLREVCVQFAVINGWIDEPDSTEWRQRCEGYGGPEDLLLAFTSATRQAVAQAAEQSNIEELGNTRRGKGSHE